MNHIEQGELQAYLDSEATLGARSQIDSHIKTCESCTHELNNLRAAASLFTSALRGTDAQAPTFAAHAAVSAARGGGRPRRFAFSRVALSRAAVLLIGFAALASAAIPGSPMRGWITTALRTIGIGTHIETVSAPPAGSVPVAPANQTAAGPATLSIQPIAGRVRVVLSDVDPAATIHIRVIDGDRVVIQASGAAAHARFRTGPGSAELIGVGKGEITIDLPRAATDARVKADGKVLFPRSNDKLKQ